MPRRIAPVLAAAIIASLTTLLPTSAAQAVDAGAGTYVGVQPTRILDTRTGNGAPKAPVAARHTLNVAVGGRGGVPANASAVTVNISVLTPAGNGTVTAWATGRARPGTSTVTYTRSLNTTNGATLKLGADGKLSLYTSAKANLVADVTGYYKAGAASTPGAYVALNPARVLNTSTGAGAPKKVVRAGGTLTVAIAGHRGVPARATAVTVNLTASNPSRGGAVTAWPTGRTRPGTPTLTYVGKQSISNDATLKLGKNGKVSLYTTAATHLQADITGYYLPGTAVTPGAYVPLTTTRLLDTRTGNGAAKAAIGGGRTTDLLIGGRGGVPANAGAVTLNLSVATPSRSGTVTAWPTGTTRPDTTALAYHRKTAYAVGSSIALGHDGRISLSPTAATHLAADVEGYFLGAPPAPVAPTVSGIAAASGTTNGGDTVTLTGTNLSTATSVTFDGVPATIVSSSGTSVQVTTPAHAAGAVQVTVTTPAGTATTSFTYVAPTPVAPTLSAVAPTSATTDGGTTVTLTGTHLTGATSVTFDGVNATSYTVNSATSITAVTPAHAAGAVQITVATAGGTADTSFTYVTPAPTLSAVAPTSGTTAGGTTVTLTGTHLTGATAVTFDGTTATDIVVVSDTTITATTPAHAAGTVDVVVTTPAGTATTNYTYVAPAPPAPTLTTIAPTSGTTLGGTTVTLTGTHLTGATGVTFDGTTATNIVVVSDTEITATTPAHAAGTVDVVVTTPAGTATTAFSYHKPPSAASVAPQVGPIAGGTTVTITGTDLTGATGVTFGNVAATNLQVVSDTQVTVTAPAHALGAVDVKLTNPYGTTTVSNGFTYVAAPHVTGVNPAAGPVAGGTTITLTGTSLSGTTAVLFGGPTGTAGTNIVVNSDTSVTVTTPAHAVGTAIISLTTPAGTDSTQIFTYVAAPTIASASPNFGPTSGGTRVVLSAANLSGQNLYAPDLTITFDGVPGTHPYLTNSTPTGATTLSIDAPAHAAGTVTILLTTAGGTATTNYTYVAPPTVTAITADSGSTTGGDSVTLTGSGFTGVTSVTFDGTAGTALTPTSDTSLTVTTPAHYAGKVQVTVTNPAGSGTTLYTYTGAATTGPCGNTGVLTGTTTLTCTYNGVGSDLFRVPDDVTALSVTVTGAQGGTSKPPAIAGGPAGAGGQAKGTLPVTAGDALQINVAGSGGRATSLNSNGGMKNGTSGGSGASGGFGGSNGGVAGASGDANGGAGGSNPGNGGNGSGGGGASDIRQASGGCTSLTCTLADRVLVGPGGGGSGGNGGQGAATSGGGGAGGGLTGLPGLGGAGGGAGNPGSGGSQTAGGLGGLPNYDPNDGSCANCGANGGAGAFGPGGVGGDGNSVTTNYNGVVGGGGGGGAGAGYYGGGGSSGGGSAFGGGGGSGAGGSGGSAYAAPSVGSPTLTSNVNAGSVNSGNGQVVISWTAPPPTLTSLSPASGSTVGGTTVTLTGTHLTGTSAVEFDGVAATDVVVVSDTTVTAKAPTHAVGQVTVKVTTPTGSATRDYTYVNQTAQISIGNDHGCVLLGDGTVSCWGENVAPNGSSTPYVGDGGSSNSVIPVRVPGLTDVRAVAAGGNSSCAVLADGSVKCWGQNDRGQLGNGSTGSPSAAPVAVQGITTAKSIAVGGSFACATLADGTARCWGYSNGAGSLGNGSTADSNVPVVVTGVSNAVSVSAGTLSACALLADQTVKCWGRNDGGALGDGTTTNRSTPVVVKSAAGDGTPLAGVLEVESQSRGRCAVMSDHTIDCWGTNTNGQVGDGTTTNALLPKQVPGLSGAISVGNGFSTSCAVLDSGSVKCWGQNNLGQLGNGTTTEAHSPVAVAEIDNALAVAGGVDFSCALLSTGGVKCWGNNTPYAQLGNGTLTSSLTPTTTYGLPYTTAAPTAAGVNPAHGPKAGGNDVTITGTHLGHTTDVWFGTVKASNVTVNDDTSITVTVPAAPVGIEVDLRVATTGGAITMPNAYAFEAPAPTATSLSVPQGSSGGNTSVTVNGTDLTKTTSVTIDGTSVPFTVLGDAQVRFNTPVHVAGAVPVVVTTPAGSTDPLTYTYVDVPPSITSFSPVTGKSIGGEVAQLRGIGFYGGTVTMQNVGDDAGTTKVTLTPTSASENFIAIAMPGHAAGDVTLTITTPFGSASKTYTYTAVAPTFSIANSRASGDPAGGYTRTIIGTNLQDATVTWDGVVIPTTIQAVGTKLQVVVPAHAAGAVDVTVATFGGSVTKTFTYAALSIDAISQSSGPTAGGNLVWITGTSTNYSGTIYVDGVLVIQSGWKTVNGQDGPSFIMPAHAAGPVTVKLVDNDGFAATTTYTYADPPS